MPSTSTPPPTTTPTPTGPCSDESFELLGSKCYKAVSFKYVEQRVTHVNALSGCSVMGAKLVEPRSAEEYNAIEYHFQLSDYWMGITDLAEKGTYVGTKN